MNARRFLTALAVALLPFLGLVSACSRGIPFDEQPVRIIPDLEEQRKVKAQAYAPFFEDGRAMRTPPAGTVALGTLKGDSTYYAGSVDGVRVAASPVPFTAETLRRGRERYNIYCSPCHDQTGGGEGLVIARGFVPPPKLWEQRIVDHPDGMLFHIISNGIRTMPAYKHQIPVEDRWAIVGYVRALQRAHNATLDDVPASERNALR